MSAGNRNSGDNEGDDGESWAFRRVRGLGEIRLGVDANRPGARKSTPSKKAKKFPKKSLAPAAKSKPRASRKSIRTPIRRRAAQRSRDRMLGRLGYVAAVLMLWGGILFGGVVFYYTLSLPDTSSLWDVERTPGLTVMGATNEVLTRRGELFGGRISLDNVPHYLVDAVIATEDKHFYYHFGIDPLGLGRAMLANLRAGALVQGGSTVTQQLAKNVFLKPERTWRRKIQELVLAFWLETQFSKDQIMTLYLNRVYFGAGAYGLEAASQRYFNKSARDLSLSESAMLVGLLKAPSRYAPTNNLERAQARAATVLARMVHNGDITRAEGQAAFDRPARVVGYAGSGSVNYFVDWMVDSLPDYAGRPDTELIVDSTIDPFMQDKAEAVIEEALARDGANLGVGQVALIAMTTDGAVRALVGGRSYARSQFNRATQARRQPGSAFKPIVYLTALEQGLEPDTLRVDEPITVDDWSPSNYSGDYRGTVTLTEALSYSINTVTVGVSEEVGRDQVIRTARRLGIQTDLALRPSLALGTFEVSLLELTAAYAPFANGGYGVIPYGIERVATGEGEELYLRQGSGLGQIIDPRELGQMNYMLSQVMRTGTGRKAALPSRPAAGKTGTSQGFRDAWFIGYTADLIVGIWVGNDNGAPMNKVTGGGLPAVMWRDFMHRTQSDMAITELPGTYQASKDIVGSADGRRAWEEPGFFERLFGFTSSDSDKRRPTLKPGRPSKDRRR